MEELPKLSDLLSARGWLLIVVAIGAFAPAHYVWRHVLHSPSRRDITRPPEDLNWRTLGMLRRNLLILLSLLGFALFIFTPVGERWARDPSFFPLLVGGMGAFSLFTVLRAFKSGKIEPLVRGINESFERDTQPKRFWAAATWNVTLGAVCVAAAFGSNFQPSGCFDSDTPDAARDAIAWCSAQIPQAKSDQELADLLADRGRAHYTLNNYRDALADYSAAIRLDPRDDSSHYNRGLIFQDLGDVWSAAAEYDAALKIDPDDADARERRSEVEEVLTRHRASAELK